MDEIHVYMCFHIASIKSIAGNETRFLPSPFLLSTSWFLILADAFRNDHLAASSTAFRSVTEKNGMGGYVTVLFSPTMSERSSRANWLKF